MAKKWSEVSQSEAFLALPPEQKEAARNQYFDQVVAPQIGDQGQIQMARQQFDAQTRITDLPSISAVIPDELRSAAQSAQQKMVVPTGADEMSGFDRFRAGVGKSLVDTAQGLVQATVDQGTRVTGVGDLIADSGIGGERFSAGVRRANEMWRAPQNYLRQQVAERRALDKGLTDTGAGMAGNVLGTIAQVLGPGIAARGTASASALLPTTIRGNALQGALIGYTQPVVDSGERNVNALAGGALGGGVAGLANLAGGAVRVGRNLLSQTGLTATERRAAEVLARESTNPNMLTIQQSAVPGVQRTLGEASGDPGLMALENVMRAQQRGTFDPIDLRNNAARVSQLQKIAGSEGDMAAAEAAREAVVDTRLAQSVQEGQSYEQSLRAAQQAERKSALDAAEIANAENRRLESLRLPGRVPVPEVPSGEAQVSEGLKNLRGMVSKMQAETAARPSVQSAVNDVGRALRAADESVGSLYQVRQYVGDLLQGNAGADKSYARAASRELMQIRDALDSELAARAPSFPEYLSAYRKASKPINRMDMGREILNRATGSVDDALGNPVLTQDKFGRATADLDAIAYKATEFKKAKASDILTPEDFRTLRAIQDDLQRIATRAKSATPGSQTAERFGIGERIAKKSLVSKLDWIGPLFEHFESAANQRLSERLAYLMANPAEAQRVMQALPKPEREVVRKTLGQLAYASGRSATPASD